MGVFDRQRQTVKRLIEKYGESVVIKTLAYTIPDPLKPWELTEIPPSQVTAKMLFLAPGNSGVTMLGRELFQYLSGSQSVTGELRGYLSWEFSPKVNDLVIRSSKELKIKSIDSLAPNEQTLLHTIEFTL